jgi:hypothetical protein
MAVGATPTGWRANRAGAVATVPGGPGRSAGWRLPALVTVTALAVAGVARPINLAAQAPPATSPPPDSITSTDSTRPARRQPAFRFSREAGLGLRAMWEESVSAKQERVACLSAEIRNDTVSVARILELVPHDADSMSIGSEASILRCGPPNWSGTVHTHVAAYSDDRPSTLFSAQDRGVMRRWYQRWQADGVFCLVYSARDAHCEADGVVGGMRGGRPRRAVVK